MEAQHRDRSSLARQLAILRLCAEGPTGFNDLRRALEGMPANTLSRHLALLRRLGLLTHHDDLYSLGKEAMDLGRALGGRLVARRHAQPAIDDLARQTGCSAAYMARRGREIVAAAKSEPPGGFRFRGLHFAVPLRDTPFLAAILAGMTAAERRELARSLALEAGAMRALLAGARRGIAGDGWVGHAIRQRSNGPAALLHMLPVRAGGRVEGVVVVASWAAPTPCPGRILGRCLRDAGCRLGEVPSPAMASGRTRRG